MIAILSKYGLELLFGLISAGALAFCKYLWGKNKELEKLQKEDENRKYRQMIISEIEPILDELAKAEDDIKFLGTDVKSSIAALKATADSEHKHMYNDLETIQENNDRKFNLIINSYKFRLIQLCKSHLRDNFITEDDFEQITEMYKLYHGLGGNGQAQEYYDKVLKLEVVPNDKKEEK